MRKTKSWLKPILVVVMAIILVVSLVACNKPGGNNNNNEPVVTDETLPEYFTALWNAAAPIGQTPIGATADIAIAFGAEIALNTRDIVKAEIYQQIDIGLDIQAVIGRTKATQKNTAIKVRLYDPTDEANEEIVTIYEFATDIDNLYIDFAGKNVKLPHGFAKLIWNEILGNKTDLADNIYEGLVNKFIQIGSEKKSINDLINYFVSDFGKDWTLNSLVGGLLDIMDVNVVDIINNSDLSSIILPMFGVESAEDLLDANGRFNLLDVLINLGTQMEEMDGIESKLITQGDLKTHRFTLAAETLSMLDIVPGLGDIVGLLISDNKMGAIEIEFSEKNNRIQDFALKLVLDGLNTQIDGTKYVPELVLKINTLKIENLTTENGISLKADKSKYTDNIAVNEKLEFEANGIRIGAIDGLTTEDIYLNGKITVGIQGKLDIVNLDKNTTQLAVKVELANRNEAAKVIAEGSYANGKIAVQLAQPMADGTKGFVYDLGANFNVAAVVQNKIKEIIGRLFPSIGDNGNTPNEGGAQTAAEGTTGLEIIGNICKKIRGGAAFVLAMVKTDNNIEISTSNILETVIDIKEGIAPGAMSDVWTVENRTKAIVERLVNTEYKDKNIAECLDIIKAEIAKLTPGTETTPAVTWNDIKVTVENAALRIFYICASQLRLDGVNTDNLKPEDYNKYQGGAEFTDTDKIYTNHIIAVLGAQITVKGDVQKGVHGSIEIKVADASIAIRSSLDLIDITSGTFKDIYAANKAEIEKADSPWVNIGNMIA